MIDSTFTTETFGNTVAQWGYRDDGDMGLLYIGARWYDPAVGRWTSADKWLGNVYRPLSLNRYLYCEDDPVNLVDPSGYKIEGWDQLAAGTAGLLAVGAVFVTLNTPVAVIEGFGLIIFGGVISGYLVGDWIADHWMPRGPDYVPPSTDDERKRYRDELEEGWYSGEIPRPPHPKYRRPPAWRMWPYDYSDAG